MTIKHRRTNIRKAEDPGPRVQTQSPRPEQPVTPDGRTLGGNVTYEALVRYHRAAETKLSDYQTLVQDVYRLIEAGKTDAAKHMLHEFDRSHPRLETPKA